MKFALLLISAVAFAAPSVVVTGTTSQQITVDIRGLTGTPQQCSVTAYLDAALTVKANDTNVAIFVGSEACPRAYNVVVGNQVTAVIGRRTSDPADCVSSCAETAGTLVSRSLELARAYWIKVTDTANSTSTVVTAVTKNIPWGDTQKSDPPVTSDGRIANPDLDWTDAGSAKNYVDPETGVAFHRVMRDRWGQLELSSATAFTKVFDEQTAWTNPNNALNGSSGPFASYSGTARAPLFFPFSSAAVNNVIWFGGPYIDDIQITLNGSCTSTGDPEDCKALACLATNYVIGGSCASAEIELALPTSTNSVSGPASPNAFPKYLFAGWGFTKAPIIEDVAVPRGTSAVVSSSTVTLAPEGGTASILPQNAVSGAKIQIGGSWYTIGTITSATTFALQESSVNISKTGWEYGGFGVRIRKKTANNNSINVSASHKVAYGEGPSLASPVNALPRTCSNLTLPVLYAADGSTLLSKPKTGRICTIGGYGSGPYFVLLADDGETRYLSDLDHGDTTGFGISIRVPDNPFSKTDPYSMVAIHVDDSYGYVFNTSDPVIQAHILNAYRSFYRVTYDYLGASGNPSHANCKLGAFAGHAYKTTNPDDCFVWTNLTPGNGHPGGTVSEKILTGLTSLPYYNSGGDFGLNSFDFALIVGDFADLVAKPPALPQGGNDTVVVHAIFDLRDYSLVKMYDTLSGALPGVRWMCPHNVGYTTGLITDDGSYGADLTSSCLGKNGFAEGNGPHRLKSINAVSFDGTNWDTNTSISPGSLITTSTAAGKCGTPPAWVVGNQCVDLTRAAGPCPVNSFGIPPGSLQCVWLKIPDDRPCDTRPSTAEATRWTCPWDPGNSHGWSNIMNMTLDVGDNIIRVTDSGDNTAYIPDGKNEVLHSIVKTSDGAGGWIYAFVRWYGFDNPTSDYTKGAFLFYDHLFAGPGGSTHPNGWNAGTAASVWSWVELGTAPNNTRLIREPLLGPSGHTGFGISVDGTTVSAIAGGESRVGLDPNTGYYFFELYKTPFAGYSIQTGSGYMEQYPGSNADKGSTTRQRRAYYFDVRHLNPPFGTGLENPIKSWDQTFTLLSGQTFTYRIDGMMNGDIANHKALRPSVFSPRNGWHDISSAATGNIISDSTPWAYCYAYKANECRTGSTVGQFFAVAPNANVGFGGCVVNTYRFYTPCVAVVGHFWGWMIQGNAQKDDPVGTLQRRISRAMTSPGGQYQFSAPHPTPDVNQIFLKLGWPSLVRPDYIVVQMPPPSEPDSIDRSNYIKVPVKFPAGSGFIRAKFGYSDYGSVTDHFCTSRREGCVTDASLAPFAFEASDTLTGLNCSSGCTLNIPALSGKVMYYQIERSANGTSGWVSGPNQVTAIP